MSAQEHPFWEWLLGRHIPPQMMYTSYIRGQFKIWAKKLGLSLDDRPEEEFNYACEQGNAMREDHRLRRTTAESFAREREAQEYVEIIRQNDAGDMREENLPRLQRRRDMSRER